MLCPLSAQSFYDIFVKSYECVDEYTFDYDKETNLHVNMKAYIKLNNRERNKIKKISKILMEAGFKFSHDVDTLLFDFVYEDHIVGSIPSGIYAQSSKMIKILTIDSYSELNYIEESMPSQYISNYYSMMYSGQVKEVNDFLLTKGKTLGCYSATIRIVIYNGRIVTPSTLWRYDYIIPQTYYK